MTEILYQVINIEPISSPLAVLTQERRVDLISP
jgi:hypothetical protein